MFNKNIKKQLKEQKEKLEKVYYAIFKSEPNTFFYYTNSYNAIERLEKKVEYQEKIIKMLLDKLRLEYVKTPEMEELKEKISIVNTINIDSYFTDKTKKHKK